MQGVTLDVALEAIKQSPEWRTELIKVPVRHQNTVQQLIITQRKILKLWKVIQQQSFYLLYPGPPTQPGLWCPTEINEVAEPWSERAVWYHKK